MKHAYIEGQEQASFLRYMRNVLCLNVNVHILIIYLHVLIVIEFFKSNVPDLAEAAFTKKQPNVIYYTQ